MDVPTTLSLQLHRRWDCHYVHEPIVLRSSSSAMRSTLNPSILTHLTIIDSELFVTNEEANGHLMESNLRHLMARGFYPVWDVNCIASVKLRMSSPVLGTTVENTSPYHDVKLIVIVFRKICKFVWDQDERLCIKWQDITLSREVMILTKSTLLSSQLSRNAATSYYQ